MPAFFGPDQKERRIDALCLQRAILGERSLAEAIEAVGEPARFDEGDNLIDQGADDDEVYFLLSGFVDIEISGHPYLRREARELVGEMAILEPGSRRSATVRAGSGGVVALRVACQDFLDVGKKECALWMNVARELSCRLRQRSDYFIQPNPVPRIFVASSGLGRAVLQVVEDVLSGSSVEILPWTDPSIFSPSLAPMEALEEQARRVDFAIIIATADDYVTRNYFKAWRQTTLAARDNVLLEFGLFAGALDRRRVFILAEDNPRLALPTDLGGLTTLRFKDMDEVRRRTSEMQVRIGLLGPIRRMRNSLAK